MKTQLIFFKNINLLVSFLFLTTICKAQNGSLDLSFGNGGSMTTSIINKDYANSVALQSDGKIVVGGHISLGFNSDFALVRYTINGTLDTTFGNNGIVITDIDSTDFGKSVAIQTDGKIIMAGVNNNEKFILIRYNTDGTVDTTFGISGKVITNITGTNSFSSMSMLIQIDGKIVIASTIDSVNNDNFILIRYNSNGTFDNTFGIGGIQTTDIGSLYESALSVAIQTDGKIVVCGKTQIGGYYDFAILRYNSNGILDNSFGLGGIITTSLGITDVATSLAIQNDNKIVVGGYTYNGVDNNFALVRYNTDGTLDTNFGNGGITITANDSADYAFSVKILSDGKIILAGSSEDGTYNFRLDCYKTDGTLDSTFGNNGMVITDLTGNESGGYLAIQNDGKIVLVGYTGNGILIDIAVLRYNYGDTSPEGFNDKMNQTNVLKSFPNPFTKQTTLQFQKKLNQGTLIIYNYIGQQVKQLNHLSGKEIILNRDNLTPGFYTLQLIENNKTIATGKLIVED